MSKQADTILALQLFSSHFTGEQLRRNYDYYQTVTLHHSSLSTCVFGMLACRVGRTDDAVRYFADSARMDLDDYHGFWTACRSFHRSSRKDGDPTPFPSGSTARWFAWRSHRAVQSLHWRTKPR